MDKKIILTRYTYYNNKDETMHMALCILFGLLSLFGLYYIIEGLWGDFSDFNFKRFSLLLFIPLCLCFGWLYYSSTQPHDMIYDEKEIIHNHGNRNKFTLQWMDVVSVVINKMPGGRYGGSGVMITIRNRDNKRFVFFRESNDEEDYFSNFIEDIGKIRKKYPHIKVINKIGAKR